MSTKNPLDKNERDFYSRRYEHERSTVIKVVGPLMAFLIGIIIIYIVAAAISAI